MAPRIPHDRPDRSNRRSITTIGVVAASALLGAGTLGAFAGPAGAIPAQQEAEPALEVQPSTVALGGEITVEGTCTPEADGQTAPVILGGGIEGGQLGEVRTDPVSGEFQATIQIPEPPGATGQGQILVGCGLGADRDPRAPITIVAPDEAEDGRQPDGRQPDGAERPPTAVGPGDRGELVEFWQARWNDWARVAEVDFGPLDGAGIFGPRPEEATRIFQDANDRVPTDGIVNPEDRVALREAIEAVNEGAPPISQGDTGVLVEYWQSRLNDWLAATQADVERLAVDGVFGPRTAEITRMFQEASDAVPTDGIVNPEDRTALREAIESARESAPAISRGATGELVEFWQARYNDWVAVTGAEFGPIEVDGIFGPRTEQATRVFQEANDQVPTDLVVNPEDRVALREAIEAAGGDGAGDDAQPVGELRTPPISAGDFPATGEASQLTDVAIGDHGNFERVTFDFGSDDLSYRLEYVDQVAGASGQPVDVEGEATLQLTISPATAHADGEQTFDRERIAAAAAELVNEVKLVEDFENQLAFAIGLDRQAEVATDVLTDPTRLVLDVREQQDG